VAHRFCKPLGPQPLPEGSMQILYHNWRMVHIFNIFISPFFCLSRGGVIISTAFSVSTVQVFLWRFSPTCTSNRDQYFLKPCMSPHSASSAKADKCTAYAHIQIGSRHPSLKVSASFQVPSISLDLLSSSLSLPWGLCISFSTTAHTLPSRPGQPECAED
jgi:hypothetical protein